MRMLTHALLDDPHEAQRWQRDLIDSSPFGQFAEQLTSADLMSQAR